MPRFTLWIRFHTRLAEAERQVLLGKFDAVLKRYHGREVGPGEYDFEFEDGAGWAMQHWDEVKHLFSDKAFFVRYDHATNSVDFLDELTSSSAEMKEIVASLPTDLPARIREMLRASR